MSEEFGIELSNVHEIPGADLVTGGIQNQTRTAVGKVIDIFRVAAAPICLPFFRKEMGERYYSHSGHFAAPFLWLLATIIAFHFENVRSFSRPFLDFLHLKKWETIFLDVRLTVLSGAILAIVHYILGSPSVKTIKNVRSNCEIYHSRSQGIPRWRHPAPIAFAIALPLLAFNMPAGILFLFSCSIVAAINIRQQNAIEAAYLDAMDRYVEQNFTEDGLLGNCETAITHFSGPLSAKLDPNLRENIAAANAGKPLRAVEPKRHFKTQPPEASHQSTTQSYQQHRSKDSIRRKVGKTTAQTASGSSPERVNPSRSAKRTSPAADQQRIPAKGDGRKVGKFSTPSSAATTALASDQEEKQNSPESRASSVGPKPNVAREGEDGKKG